MNDDIMFNALSFKLRKIFFKSKTPPCDCESDKENRVFAIHDTEIIYNDFPVIPVTCESCGKVHFYSSVWIENNWRKYID